MRIKELSIRISTRHNLVATPALQLPAMQRQLGHWFWIGVCCSMAAIMLAPLIGWINAAVFLGFWFIAGIMLPRETLRAVASSGPLIWAIPIMAFLSVLWSEDPDFTLRSAIQYASTVAAATMMARQLRPGQFIAMLMVSTLFVSVVSFVFGRYDIDPMTGVSTFVGVFGSKNILAFFSSLMMLSSIAVAVDSKQNRVLRLLAMVAFLISIPTIISTRSATAQVTAIIASTVFFLVLFYFFLTPLSQAVIALITSIITAPLLLLAFTSYFSETVENFVSGVLGKSMTLTGRTTLWRYAQGLIAERPLLGHGWGGFWRRENVEAEGLWRLFQIKSRAGFHFHSAYFEIGVQLGFVGIAIISVLYLTALLKTFCWVARNPSPVSAFMFTIAATMTVRSFVEVDILSPFSLGLVLLTVAIVYSANKNRIDKNQ